MAKTTKLMMRMQDGRLIEVYVNGITQYSTDMKFTFVEVEEE